MVEKGRGLSRRPIANLPQEKRQQPGLVPSSENNADATTLEAWTLLLVPNSPAFHEYRQRIDGAGPVLSGRWREKPRHIISHNGHSAPVAQLQYHLLLIEQCTRYTIRNTTAPRRHLGDTSSRDCLRTLRIGSITFDMYLAVGEGARSGALLASVISTANPNAILSGFCVC